MPDEGLGGGARQLESMRPGQIDDLGSTRRTQGGCPIGAPNDRVTVVVPTYNEIGTLETAAEGVVAHGYRLLIVDDNSPDGTGVLADSLSRQSPLISALHRTQKAGLGRAYAAGFAVALESGAEVVCEMDADLSHDPARLPALVAAIEAGADVAIGSRLVPGGEIVDWPAWRRLLSRGGNRFSRFALGVPVHDITSGFRAFRADSLQRLDAASSVANGYTFQIEMVRRAHSAGMQVTEVPITFVERTAGESKMDTRIVFEAMRLVTYWGLKRLFMGRRR